MVSNHKTGISYNTLHFKQENNADKDVLNDDT